MKTQKTQIITIAHLPEVLDSGRIHLDECTLVVVERPTEISTEAGGNKF